MQAPRDINRRTRCIQFHVASDPPIRQSPSKSTGPKGGECPSPRPHRPGCARAKVGQRSLSGLNRSGRPRRHSSQTEWSAYFRRLALPIRARHPFYRKWRHTLRVAAAGATASSRRRT